MLTSDRHLSLASAFDIHNTQPPSLLIVWIKYFKKSILKNNSLVCPQQYVIVEFIEFLVVLLKYGSL